MLWFKIVLALNIYDTCIMIRDIRQKKITIMRTGLKNFKPRKNLNHNILHFLFLEWYAFGQALSTVTQKYFKEYKKSGSLPNQVT